MSLFSALPELVLGNKQKKIKHLQKFLKPLWSFFFFFPSKLLHFKKGFGKRKKTDTVEDNLFLGGLILLSPIRTDIVSTILDSH